MSFSVSELNQIQRENIIFRELDAGVNSGGCGFNPPTTSTAGEQHTALQALSDDE